MILTEQRVAHSIGGRTYLAEKTETISSHKATCKRVYGNLRGILFRVLPVGTTLVPGGFKGEYWVATLPALPKRSLTDLYALWEILGEIPVSEGNDEVAADTIDESFLQFPIGTHREEIWHWFETQNSRFLAGEVQSGIRLTETDEERFLRTISADDLPGYTLSNRGVAGNTGFYVLPPGGNPLDDRDYLGYFKTDMEALSAARQYRDSVGLCSIA